VKNVSYFYGAYISSGINSINLQTAIHRPKVQRAVKDGECSKDEVKGHDLQCSKIIPEKKETFGERQKEMEGSIGTHFKEKAQDSAG